MKTGRKNTRDLRVFMERHGKMASTNGGNVRPQKARIF